MSGRCAENIWVSRDALWCEENLQRLSALSVSASGHRPANPLTGLHIHNLMIWDDGSLISDPARPRGAAERAANTTTIRRRNQSFWKEYHI